MPSSLYVPAVAAAFFVESLLRAFGKPHPLLTVQVARETFGYKYYSSKKAREDLQWNPRVDIKEAVEKAFCFYKKEGLIR
jgi:nucleoside-diphosphate-sugar epimerase